jgi:hypothetical protein
LQRQVKSSELPMVVERSSVSYMCRSSRSPVSSKRYSFSFNPDGRRPNITYRKHTFESALVACVKSAISAILVLIRNSQIIPTIIQSITIDVIQFCHGSKGKTKNHVVHCDSYFIFSLGVRISIKQPSASFGFLLYVPSIFHQFAVIILVYESIPPFCQRNFSNMFPFNDKNLVDNGRLIVPHLTMPTQLRPSCLQFATLWTRIVAVANSADCLTFFGRILSWLGSLFSQMHFSPPRERCGLATLQLF